MRAPHANTNTRALTNAHTRSRAPRHLLAGARARAGPGDLGRNPNPRRPPAHRAARSGPRRPHRTPIPLRATRRCQQIRRRRTRLRSGAREEGLRPRSPECPAPPASALAVRPTVCSQADSEAPNIGPHPTHGEGGASCPSSSRLSASDRRGGPRPPGPAMLHPKLGSPACRRRAARIMAPPCLLQPWLQAAVRDRKKSSPPEWAASSCATALKGRPAGGQVRTGAYLRRGQQQLPKKPPPPGEATARRRPRTRPKHCSARARGGGRGARQTNVPARSSSARSKGPMSQASTP